MPSTARLLIQFLIALVGLMIMSFLGVHPTFWEILGISILTGVVAATGEALR